MPNKQAPEQWLQDKELVVQSLQDAHIENAKLKETLQALDSRLILLEAEGAKQMAKIAALEEDLAKEKESESQPQNKLRTTQKKKALNQRLDELSAKLNPEQIKQKDALAEKNAYTAAYLALKSGRYDEASTGFNSVIKTYADGDYTDQAYYWLGEALLALHQQKEAKAAFATVATNYPVSTKHAAALLKLANIYKNMHDYKASQKVLHRIISEHPDSSSAESARTLLDEIQHDSGAKK